MLVVLSTEIENVCPLVAPDRTEKTTLPALQNIARFEFSNLSK